MSTFFLTNIKTDKCLGRSLFYEFIPTMKHKPYFKMLVLYSASLTLSSRCY